MTEQNIKVMAHIFTRRSVKTALLDIFTSLLEKKYTQ